jgi:hypothetical protein
LHPAMDSRARPARSRARFAQNDFSARVVPKTDDWRILGVSAEELALYPVEQAAEERGGRL